MKSPKSLGQQAKQLDGKNYADAHQEGINAENTINGTSRGTTTVNTGVTVDAMKIISGTFVTSFSRNGQTVSVSVSIRNNNIKSVSQKIENPKNSPQ